jgi:hypothetical protein
MPMEWMKNEWMWLDVEACTIGRIAVFPHSMSSRPRTLRHSITSRNTRILNSRAMRTLNFSHYYFNYPYKQVIVNVSKHCMSVVNTLW